MPEVIVAMTVNRSGFIWSSPGFVESVSKNLDGHVKGATAATAIAFRSPCGTHDTSTVNSGDSNASDN